MDTRKFIILAINPGSTSTKIAVFQNERELFSANITHTPEDLAHIPEVDDQLAYRKDMVERELARHGLAPGGIDVFVGRGGGLVPICGGTYAINEALLRDARRGLAGKHPAQLASQMCELFVAEHGGEAFVVNPPDVDEYVDVARITGFADVFRESRIHTLNQKEIALRYCAKQGKRYEDSELIVCHIGGGISITAHHHGRMVDSNDIMAGEGPMAPTRAGALPAVALLKLAFSGAYTEKQLCERIYKTGGLLEHLGTADARAVENRINAGDTYAKLVYDAMIYQIAKSVGACACTLKGRAEAILLTGGLAKSAYIIEGLAPYIGWIAPVAVMAGEFEMEALAAGALRVLTGQEQALTYTGLPVWQGFAR